MQKYQNSRVKCKKGCKKDFPLLDADTTLQEDKEVFSTDLPEWVSEQKRIKLLCPNTGLTDINVGRTMYMHDFLKSYSVLMKQLQMRWMQVKSICFASDKRSTFTGEFSA